MPAQHDTGGGRAEACPSILQASPLWGLAERVVAGRLTLDQALARVAELSPPNDATINQQDACIRSLAKRDRDRALILAELNLKLAGGSRAAALHGNCHNTLGWLYSQHRQLERARSHYEAALQAYTLLGQAQRSMANIQLELGAIGMSQGQIGQAEVMYRAALDLVAATSHQDLELVARYRLGHVLLLQGRATQASAEIKRALELSRICNDRVGEERALGNQGLVYYYLGELDKAETCQFEALKMSHDLGQQVDSGHHLNHLARVLIARGRLAEAGPYLQEALEIAHQRGDQEAEQQRRGNLGVLYQAYADAEAGQREEWLHKALTCYQQAKAIARDRKDDRRLSRFLLNEGNIHRALDRWEDAHTHYQKALTLAQEHHMADTEWRVCYAWGCLFMLQKQYSQAFAHYAHAITIVEQQRNQLDQIEMRSKFWQEKTILYKQMALCCLRRGDLWQALVYTERAKARYLADLFGRSGAPRKGVRAGWRGKARYLADLFGRSGAPRDDTRAIIERAIAGLPPRSAIVVFNVIDEGAAIFIATPGRDLQIDATPDADWRTWPDGRLHACLLKTLNRKALQDLLVQIDQNGSISGYLGDYHTNSQRWYASTLRQTCEELSTSLLRVVDQALHKTGVERLILMPNLGLSLLPLHACPIDGADGPICLLHRYEISYAPSFELLQYAQARVQEPARAGRRLLAVATPNENLYWAGVEAAALKEQFKDLGAVRVLDHTTVPQATPTAVVRLAPENTYIHVACHGVFNLAEPLLSALNLIGGDLTLQNMLSSDVSDSTAGLSLPRTRLVVLGACEIGVVDFADLADEGMSLPSGFMLAGSPAVLATLWEVDDLATSMLMEQFYKYHLHGDPDHPQEGPLGPAAALRRAQIWLRDEVTVEQVEARVYQHRPHFSGKKRRQEDSRLHRLRKETLDGPRGHPFAHPSYWAAFTITSV